MAMAPSSPRSSRRPPSSATSSSSSSSDGGAGAEPPSPSSSRKRQLMVTAKDRQIQYSDVVDSQQQQQQQPQQQDYLITTAGGVGGATTTTSLHSSWLSANYQHQQQQQCTGAVAVPAPTAAQAMVLKRSTTSTLASSPTSNATSIHAYRLHFSCQHVGKYRHSTKRRLEWKFGFTNLQAAREGKSGADCRGEEHEILLIWSVLSGKIRVHWNKNDITHLFREARQERRETVDISWQARSGATFQILARNESISGGSNVDNQHQQTTQLQPSSRSRSQRQYDLLVDGQSFFSFSHISELVFPAMDIVNMKALESLVSESEQKAEERSDDVSSLEYDVRDACLLRDDDVDKIGLRLSMAGFVPPPEQQTNDFVTDDLMDDLTSTSMSNVVECLRARVVAMIPFSESMVSKALVYALSEEVNESCHSVRSWDSASSSFDSSPVPSTTIRFEAEVLRDTVDWINLNVQYAPRPDVEDQKLDFLQRQMDTVFMNARHERVSVHCAARVLCDVATLLDLKLSSEVSRNTLILSDLDKKSSINMNAESLIDALCKYGDLEDVGIVNNGHWFAVCRFASETGALRALSAVNRGTLEIFGRTPKASLVERPLPRKRPDLVNRRAISTPSLPVPIEKPSLGRRRSHQRNTITIDTLMSQSPQILELVKQEVGMISPLSSPSVIHLYDPDLSDTTAPDLNSLAAGSQYTIAAGGPSIPLVSPTSRLMEGSILQPDFSHAGEMVESKGGGDRTSCY